MIPYEKASQIRALVCGVDGVLTNGLIGYGSDRCELHFFDVRDGLAMRLANWNGLKVAWLTGRSSKQVMQRARDLDVSCYPGFANKEAGIRLIAHDLEVDPLEMAYIGDDLNDLPAFQMVGFPIAVANAVPEVRCRAAYVTEESGGYGAVREVVEAILNGQKRWETAIEHYLDILREPDRVLTVLRTEE